MFIISVPVENMAGIEVTSPEINNFPELFFYHFANKAEEHGQMHNKHVSSFSTNDFRRELEINALLQNKYISPIVKSYQIHEAELNKKLPEIAIKSVLNLLSDPDLKKEAPENFIENLRKVINNYEYINEEFVSELTQCLEHRQQLIEQLRTTVRMLRLIKHTTSSIALLSSAMELTSKIGAFLYTIFAADLKPKYSPLLAWVIGGVSVTGSVLAISYSRQTSEDIFRGLREEKYLLRHLMMTERKGNTIDENVKDLFPHSVDFDLVEQIAEDIDEDFMDDTAWKQNVSFAIIFHNFKKNTKLINDNKFLASVKLFVESPAAKMWLYRIKLNRLLEEIFIKLDYHLEKRLFSVNDVLNQAAINLYSIFFPLFVESRNLEKLRFIFSSMAAISAVVNLSHKDGEDFEELKRTSDILLKDHKRLKNFSQDFMSDYD